MKLLLVIALGLLAVAAEKSRVLPDFYVGYTQFTANIYKELLKSNSGSFLVCPISVDIVLALVHAGAEGKTAQQLSAGLNLLTDKEKIGQIFHDLIPLLQSNDQYNLSSANKVYIKNDFEISDQFRNTAINAFGSEIQNIDFAKNVQAAAEINRWVEGKTGGKIKDLISEDYLDDYTRAVLINALYFQGKWVKEFSKSSTRKRAFHINTKEPVEIDMMQQTSYFNYSESSELNAKFLELAYEGGEVTMTIVLPNDVEGLSALEARIADVLVAPEYDSERVHVVIPKFKTETFIEFNPILQALGIVDAFEDYADFTGIGAHQEPLKITKVVQKAFIEVGEEGTTAAAASAVIVGLVRSGHFEKPPPKEFIADHPFIYYLKTRTGILFVGRYIQG